MKKLLAPSALAVLLATAPAGLAGQAEPATQSETAAPAEPSEREVARERLADAGLAFTPEAFLKAVSQREYVYATFFVQAGIDAAARNASGRTALWIATEQRDLQTLTSMLEAGLKPDAQTAPALDGGKSLVFEAVDTGDPDFVRALVEAGADAKSANEYGVSPLAEAARVGNLEMCRLLLQAGADPNNAPGGFPMIFGPINENHPEVVRLLLESGARLGEHKPALLEAAKTPEMKALLEPAE